MRMSDWSSDVCSADRGDLITAADAPAACADQFAAHLLWMGTQPLLPGRGDWLKTAAGTVGARITEIRHNVDVNTKAALSAAQLELTEAGSCTLVLDRGDAVDRSCATHSVGVSNLINHQE